MFRDIAVLEEEREQGGRPTGQWSARRAAGAVLQGEYPLVVQARAAPPLLREPPCTCCRGSHGAMATSYGLQQGRNCVEEGRRGEVLY